MRGGSVPDCIFVGILPQRCLDGDSSSSSTRFENYGVTDMNISLNGTSVNGFPLSCKYGSPVIPLQKFLEATNRHYNIQAGGGFDCTQFAENWVWSHKFESETSSQGWLSINFTVKKAFTENMVMVVWIVSQQSVTIDQYHQVERQ